MKRFAWWPWVPGLLLLAGIGMLWQRMHMPGVAFVPTAASSADTPVTTTADAALPALPLPGADFGASREALLAHARRGHADAAWRLAEGLQECLSLGALERQTEHRDEALIARLRIECAGVRPDWHETRRWFRQAARLGSPEAQIRYVSNPMLVATSANAELEEWRDWRDAAPTYVDAAIARGDREAVLMRANASSHIPCWRLLAPSVVDACSHSDLLREISAQDDTVAYAHFLLAQRLGAAADSADTETMLARLAPGLTPAQHADAEALAQQMLLRVRR